MPSDEAPPSNRVVMEIHKLKLEITLQILSIKHNYAKSAHLHIRRWRVLQSKFLSLYQKQQHIGIHPLGELTANILKGQM